MIENSANNNNSIYTNKLNSSSKINLNNQSINIDNPRNYSLWEEIKSTNTLLNSSKIYSIPKANRFERYKQQSLDLNALNSNINTIKNKQKDLALGEYFSSSNPFNFYYDDVVQKEKRATVMGYGNKIDFSKVIFNVPGPGSYNFKSSIDLNKGFSLVGKRKENNIESLGKPSPNHYRINSFLEDSNKKIKPSIHSRRSWYYEETIKRTCELGPGQYDPKKKFPTRFDKISFGLGERSGMINCKIK